MTVQKGKIICKSVDNHVFFSFLDDHYILEVTVVRRNFRWNKTFGDLYRHHWESLNFFDFLAYYEMFKSMLDKALQKGCKFLNKNRFVGFLWKWRNQWQITFCHRFLAILNLKKFLE